MISKAKGFKFFYHPENFTNFLPRNSRFNHIGILAHIQEFNRFLRKNCSSGVSALLVRGRSGNWPPPSNCLNYNCSRDLFYRGQGYKAAPLGHGRNYRTSRFCIVPFKIVCTFLFFVDLAFSEVDYMCAQSCNLNPSGITRTENYGRFLFYRGLNILNSSVSVSFYFKFVIKLIIHSGKST
jgi:hypothetical protein